MKTAAELLREKDEELEQVIDAHMDVWEERRKLQLREKELEKRIKELEREISDLEIKWQDEIRGKKEGRHE